MKKRSEAHCKNLSRSRKGKCLGSENGRWIGGRITSRPDGYVMVTQKDHPKANKAGYVLEHRLVMENKLGRILGPSEVVHHKNGIPNDNRIENLEILSRPAHAKEHGLAKLGEKTRFKKGHS